MAGVEEASRCGRCGYDVRGLPTPVCPECGGDLGVVGTRRRAGVGVWLTGWTAAMLTVGLAAAWAVDRWLTVIEHRRSVLYLGGPGLAGDPDGTRPTAAIGFDFAVVAPSRGGRRAGPWEVERAVVYPLPAHDPAAAWDRRTSRDEMPPRPGEVALPPDSTSEAIAAALLAADDRLDEVQAETVAPALAWDLARPDRFTSFESRDGFWRRSASWQTGGPRQSVWAGVVMLALVVTWVAGLAWIARRRA